MNPERLGAIEEVGNDDHEAPTQLEVALERARKIEEEQSGGKRQEAEISEAPKTESKPKKEKMPTALEIAMGRAEKIEERNKATEPRAEAEETNQTNVETSVNGTEKIEIFKEGTIVRVPDSESDWVVVEYFKETDQYDLTMPGKNYTEKFNREEVSLAPTKIGVAKEKAKSVGGFIKSLFGFGKK